MNETQMQRILALALLLAAAVWLASGCTYYKLDIQQGNVVTDEMLSRLEPGMTQRQVHYVLGTPLVQDPFHQSRWDYVYLYRSGDGDRQERQQVVAYFDNGRLSRVEKDGEPIDLAAGQAEPETTLNPDDAIVVTGDNADIERAKKANKKKGFLRRMWDGIWD